MPFKKREGLVTCLHALYNYTEECIGRPDPDCGGSECSEHGGLGSVSGLVIWTR